MFKLPSKLKSLHRSKDVTTAKSRNASESNERFVMFLRLMEVLSLVEIDNMVFAGGRGAAVRRQALRILIRKASGRPVRVHLGSVQGVQKFWRNVRKKQSQERYHPVVLHM